MITCQSLTRIQLWAIMDNNSYFYK